MDFILRSWEKSDAADLVKYANNPEIAKFLRNAFPNPYRLEDAYQFIEFANTDEQVKIFAIVVNGIACGGIGLHPAQDIYCKNAEMGYWLGEEFWGHGIMTRAVQKMVEKGFELLEIERIYAVPFGTNIGSQRVLEKAGFVLEAKLQGTIFKNGSFDDEWIYSVRKSK